MTTFDITGALTITISGSITVAPSAQVSEYVINGGFDTGNGWGLSPSNSIEDGALKFRPPQYGDAVGALVQHLTAGVDYVLSFDVVSNLGGALLTSVANFGEVGGILGAIFIGIPIAGPVSVPFTAGDNFTHIRLNAGNECVIDNVSIVEA